ncbi:MAG: FtsX-like permease family protein [Solirubrobacterales bacterium]
MKPGVLLHLYRVRLRSRFAAELLALTGIAVGVALVFGGLVANATLTGTVAQLSHGVVGHADFQLGARSASGFDQRVFGRVRKIPGAAGAPVAEARVNLVSAGRWRSVLLLGADPRIKGVGGRLLQSPELSVRGRRSGLLIPAPLADALGVHAGAEVTVQSGAGGKPVRVAGELDRGAVGALVESPVAMAPLPLVQELAGMRRRLSRIFVAAAPGREAAVESSLRRIAGDRINLVPADAEVALLERASYPTSASTTLFATLSALVGFLFVFNAMLLVVPQRRRLIADLRITGYAPTTVILVVLVDALLLGAAGAAIGLGLGAAASPLLFDSAPAYLTAAFPIGTQRIVPWQAAGLAAGAGIAATCLAALLPLRRSIFATGEIEPVAALRSRGLALPAATGGACLALSLGVAAGAPELSLACIVVLLLGLLLLLPVWLLAVTAAFAAVSRRRRSCVAILTALQLRAASTRTRTVALAATGAVAVFAAAAIGGARGDLQRGLDRVSGNVDRGAEVWAAFRGPTDIFGATTFSLPRERLEELERLPEVRSVSRNRGSFLDVGQDRAWVLAPAPSRIAQVLRDECGVGTAELAAARVRSGGWVTLSRGLASDLHVGVGEEVDLPLPLPTRLRVAALTDNFGWPGGAVVISSPAFARAWGSSAVSLLGIRPAPGARPPRLAAATRSVLGRGSGLRIETSRERERSQKATSRAGLARLGEIEALVLAASVLAMAASMTGLVWQRRPTFAALAVHGFSRLELWRALLLESAIVLFGGCSLGAACGLAGQVLLDRALQAITGFPLVFETAVAPVVSVLVGITAAAVAILTAPAWLAVRVEPTAGLAE